jgi:hypothetical protein
MAFPKLVERVGEHAACTIGILACGTGQAGFSLVRVQPLHSTLYMIQRAGAGVADTATAALVARSSRGLEERARNLALLTSTRAAARIVSPVISGKLFEVSCEGSWGSSFFAGALPFVMSACFAMVLAPLPTLLSRAEQKAAATAAAAEWK